MRFAKIRNFLTRFLSVFFFFQNEMSCSTYVIPFSSLTSKNFIDPFAHKLPCFRFFSLLLTFPFVVRGQNVASWCQDAARMFFVSEMFLVKASRPTRCHLLSLSCLSYTSSVLTIPVRPPFFLSFVSFRFLAFYPQSLPWIFRWSAVLFGTLAICNEGPLRAAQDSRNHKSPPNVNPSQ